MTEENGQARHGEPGHVCGGQPHMIDATDSLAGVIIGQHPDFEDRLTADSWSHGLSKRAAAFILRQIADGFDADADAEESEDGAIERARTAGLN